MLDDTHETLSLWLARSPRPVHPPLEGDASVDVVVVGGGIAGVTCAYLLQRDGRRTMLLEADRIGSGETGRSTAHLFEPDDRYREIERLHGAEGARLAARSTREALEIIAGIVDREAIDCDFERLDGWLVARSGSDPADLEAEHAAASRAGVECDLHDRVPELRDWDTGPALRFAGQGQLDPLRYLDGVTRAFVAAGGRVAGGTRVQTIGETGGRVVACVLSGHRVDASAIVVATNTPIHERLVLVNKLESFRTYVVAGRVPRDSLPHLLLWEDAMPYRYVRLVPLPGPATAHEWLVVGGEDHKTGQANHGEQGWARLEAWARERFPMLGAIEHRWSGEVIETTDAMPYLGYESDSHYVITGDSGNGLTHATIGAQLVADQMAGRPNPWAKLYDPRRVSLRSALRYLRVQANVVAQYGDWATPGEIGHVSELAPGQGAIVRAGTRKLAVWRDPDSGELISRTAVCPHLGCIVRWNGAEKTWDCPCHGSRFDVRGHVLHGPATEDLGLPGGTDPESESG